MIDELTLRERRILQRIGSFPVARAMLGLVVSASLPLVCAVAHFLGRDLDPLWVFYVSPMWAFAAGMYWQESRTDSLIRKLRKRSGWEPVDPIPLSPRDMEAIRGARRNIFSIRNFVAWASLLISIVFFSPLASALPHWVAGGIGVLIGMGGGFQIGRDIGEHIVAVVRDERIRGGPSKYLWLSRCREKVSERGYLLSRYELAALAMVGPFCVYISWSGFTPCVPSSLNGWWCALEMAISSGITATASGSFSRQHLVLALHRGELDGQLRSSSS